MTSSSTILKTVFWGLIIPIIITWVTCHSQQNKTEISYNIKAQNLVATSSIDTSITILFNRDTLTNLNVVEFGLWNSGTVFIGKDMISETNPISITADGLLTIKSWKILRKSRADLTFKVVQTPKSLHLTIEGDDGLERQDGVGVQILYSGDPKVIWHMAGRIKGTISPFKEAGNSDIEAAKEITWKDDKKIILLFSLGALLLFLTLWPNMKSIFSGQRIPSIEWVFMVIGVIIFSLAFYIFWNRFAQAGSLGWYIN